MENIGSLAFSVNLRGNCAQMLSYQFRFYKINNFLVHYCTGDKIKKNEMGWACGAYGRGEGGV